MLEAAEGLSTRQNLDRTCPTALSTEGGYERGGTWTGPLSVRRAAMLPAVQTEAITSFASVVGGCQKLLLFVISNAVYEWFSVQKILLTGEAFLSVQETGDEFVHVRVLLERV